jgi:hypothetical protein
MRTTVRHIILFIVLFWITGCDYELDIDLQEPDAKIVVDGWIESSKQAKVLLTANSPYFSSIDSASWRETVLSRAKVTLDDGENSEVLILRKDARYFPPFYYAGNEIIGEAGKTYTLTAEYGGKSVISTTTIPDPVPIDTCYFEPIEVDAVDSVGYLTVEFTDPVDEKNYYRIFTMRDGVDEKFISTFIMGFNDQYFPGKKVTISLLRAPESRLSTLADNYFRLGETIIVKLSTMDKATFDFWSSYQDEVLNSANPFASSLNEVNSNIAGDGLGIWCGYGTSVDTVFTVR